MDETVIFFNRPGELKKYEAIFTKTGINNERDVNLLQKSLLCFQHTYSMVFSIWRQ